jgi:hypothetical protein
MARMQPKSEAPWLAGKIQLPGISQALQSTAAQRYFFNSYTCPSTVRKSHF